MGLKVRKAEKNNKEISTNYLYYSTSLTNSTILLSAVLNVALQAGEIPNCSADSHHCTEQAGVLTAGSCADAAIFKLARLKW